MKIGGPLLAMDQMTQVKDSKLPEDPEKLMDVCRDFESVFLNIVLKEMRKTIPESDLVEKSYAREMFESMQDEELAKEMSKGRGVGLAQELYKQLSRR